MKLSRILRSACLLPLAIATLTAKTAPPLPPNDPAALLQLASRVNGLHGNDLRPWHLKASWQTLDDHKQTREQGSLEEWWTGETQSKVRLSTSGFDQTRWLTNHGEFSAGSSGLPLWQFGVVAQNLIAPLPKPNPISGMGFNPVRDKKLSALRCFAAERLTSITFRKLCFSGDQPTIRIVETDATRIAFNTSIDFQGRSLARDLIVDRAGEPQLVIHIDEIGVIEQDDAADLAPSADAVLASPWLHVPVPLLNVHKISGDLIGYPAGSTTTRMQGGVTCSAVLGKDGKLHNVAVIGASPFFRPAVLSALSTWIYSPILLDGVRLEMELRITVDFYYENGAQSLMVVDPLSF
jgi:hypothetical protein